MTTAPILHSRLASAILLAVLTLVMASHTTVCMAQLPPKSPSPIKGNFFFAVDDTAIVYVNGKEIVKKVGGLQKSGDAELNIGDRVIIHLWQNWGARYFMIVFLSTDQKTTVSFRAKDFKNVPDISLQDFTLDQYKLWTKSPKREKHDKKLPMKSDSEWLWGELDDCLVACVISQEMVKKQF